jgi:hypothetical protein
MNGCDSTVILDLIINYSSNLSLSVVACDSYLWDGINYNNTGLYNNLYLDINGCDSLVSLDLTINNSSSYNINASSCSSYEWDGLLYYTSGLYTNIYSDINGCDSIVTLDLDIITCIPFSPSVSVTLSNLDCDSISDLTISVSQDSSEVDMNTALFVSDGGYFALSSIIVSDIIGSAVMTIGPITINTDLIVSNIVSSSEIVVEAIDQLSGVVFGNFIISNNAGTGISILAITIDDGNNYTNYGNSSVVTLLDIFTNPQAGTLNFTSFITSELNDTDIQNFATNISCICSTVYSNFIISSCDEYLWNGVLYDTSGVYIDTLLTNLGCDSILNLDLTINYSSFKTLNEFACDAFIWDGISYNSTGFYTNLYSDINGCDSTVNLDLTIYSSSVNNLNESACNYFIWDGVSYDSTGVYTNLYSDVNGCDSTVILDLNISYSSVTNLSEVACDYFVWDSFSYTQSGNYINVYIDNNGCDSTVRLDLTINSSSNNSFNEVACDSYEWDGINYTTNGLYTNIYSDINGCDSTVNLNLTIYSSSSIDMYFVVCDSLEWNGQTYVSSGVYSYNTTNINGCDSIVYLNLTVNSSSFAYDTISICNGEYFSIGTSIYSMTGDYIDTVISANGCISTIYTNLTVADSLLVSISQINSELYANVNGGVAPYSYTWNTQQITSSITPLSNGMYSLYVTDALGCFTDTAFFDLSDISTDIQDRLITDLLLYPNPTSGLFTLEFDINVISNYNIRVLNTIGEILHDENINNFSGEYIRSFDFSNYPKSLYFIEITTPIGILNKKLVIQ